MRTNVKPMTFYTSYRVNLAPKVLQLQTMYMKFQILKQINLNSKHFFFFFFKVSSELIKLFFLVCFTEVSPGVTEWKDSEDGC